jgi:prepilin-type processing-associated H-X9-DG protein
MASPANTPFAADPNPMFEGGAFAPSRESLPNSRVHNSKGQNTLFLDGSVRFLKSPVIGEPSDNIWQAEDVDQYTGTETPTVATDAFLIP